MQKLENQKLYVLALTNRKGKYITKIGETQQDLKKRIVGFGFGGKWKHREKDVEVILELDTLLAPSLERMVKKLLLKNWKENRLMDKNLGRGYTEWFFMKPTSMVAIVRKCFDILYEKDKYISKKLKEVANGK